MPTALRRQLAALLLPAALLVPAAVLGQEAEPGDVPSAPGTLVRLIDPSIAEALELTDEQKQRIAALVEQRAAALAEANDDDRPAIEASAEQQLEEVLTDEQRARWQQLMAAPTEVESDAAAKLPEKTMRFNFRFQPWSDVLSWFANEAGLSLVLDAPPPGTFNYTDAREYTLAEAIDLLNGVLLTKGYTLIRRERMLVLINFANGVPTELVPRVTIDELDKRGQFELVSVLFPIGDRNPEAVHSEIKPLVGEHGSSILLPQTRQVLVTETAGKMRSIHAVIESIPTPKPERPEPRKEPEKPSLAVYPLQSIDPEAALEVIRALMPDVKIVHDPSLNQLTAFATPTQQAGIQKALDEMRADVPPEHQRRLKVYPIKGTGTDELLTFLGSLAPKARLGFDPQSGNLAAWAAPPDQDLIAEALASMQRDAEADGDLSVETHRLDTAQASELVTMLTSVVPDAKVVASSTSNSIVALASSADHEKIRKVISQLEADSPTDNQAEVRFYPFDRPDRSTLMTTLGKLAPRADVTFDDKSKQLVVLARPDEHETVGAVIEQFLAENRYHASDARLKVYQLSPGVRRKLESALSTLADDFEGVRTIADSSDTNSGQLAIWASGNQHAKIENLIAELDQEVPPEQRQQLVAYRVESADPASVLNVLQSLLPNTRLVLDAKSRQIVAWARPDEHQVIANTVEQMDGEEGADRRYQLMSHPVGEATASTALTMLSSLLPDVQLVQDPAAGTIVAFARPDDHEVIAETLRRMQPEVPEEKRPQVVVYPVPKSDPVPLASMLQTVFPQARISGDRVSGTVTAWATNEEHEMIRSAVEQMEAEPPPDKAPKVVVYQFPSASAASAAYRSLRDVLPEVRLSVDSNSANLVAWGTPDDHEFLRSAIEQIEGNVDASKQQELAIYPLDDVDPRAVSSLLRSAMPSASFTDDRRSGTMLVWATTEEHETIRAAIDKLRNNPSSKANRTARRYPLENTDPSTAISAIRAIAPDADSVVDARSGDLVITALPHEHESIAAAIEGIESNVDPSKQQELVIYPLDDVDPRSVTQLLSSAMPSANFTDDRRSGNMLVWATKEEHETIRKSIDQLRNNPSSKANRTAQRYPLENTDPTAALSTVQALAPDAQAVIDARNSNLVVTALPHEHESIAAAIEQLESNVDPSKEQELVIYPLDDVDPRSVTQLLSSAMPSASFTDDRRSGTMLVWATKEEHEAIRESIDRMRNNPSSKANRTARRYPLENTDPTAALSAVQGLAPDAQAVIDARSGHLVVTALPHEHDAIASAIAELDGNGQQDGAQVRVYPLEVAQAADVYTTLQTLFAARPEVRLSLDPTTQKLVVSAAASQHETIRQLISELDGGQSPLDTLQLEVHALGNADAEAVSEALTPLFSKTPEVRLIPDSSSGNLVALARPNQQATIRTTIAQMQGEPEQVEVFQLHQLDPYLAELSINRLFGEDNPWRRGRGDDESEAPKIDSDSSTGQLYVRAKPEQIEQIRELLIKMGETGLDLAASPNVGSGKLRVIPLNGRSARQAMAEIEGLWSQMSDHPIRVVTPSALAPTRRRTSSDRWPGATDEAPSAVQQRSVSPQPQLPDILKPDVDDGAANQPEQNEPLLALALDDEDETPLAEALPQAEEADDDAPAPEDPPARDDRPAEEEDAASPSADEEAEPSPAPIIIAPGPDSITITSEDVEALDQFEALLRSLAQQRGPAGGREFTVFNLHNANAEIVAESLEKLFSQGFFGSRGSAGVTIVPDQRLNSLIVQASQNDLRAIENLLEVLDSSEVPETLVATKPTRIRLQNAKAEVVAEVLREVYKSQLEAGGPQLPIPSGVPRELASALQQIRAVSTGPLMTLGVDETSNSLIVLAPPPLLVEVQALVSTLDDAATEPNRTVKVLPLTKTNTETVQQALEMLMNDGSSQSRFRRSYRRSR